MKLWGLFFFIFKDCLRFFVMFVNVDIVKLSLLQVRVQTLQLFLLVIEVFL